MTIIQYIFCAVYAACAAGLIGVAAMQQGGEKGAIETLSGGSSESYYAKNMAYSAEAKKKMLTAALAIGFAVLTAVSMFILP